MYKNLREIDYIYNKDIDTYIITYKLIFLHLCNQNLDIISGNITHPGLKSPWKERKTQKSKSPEISSVWEKYKT